MFFFDVVIRDGLSWYTDVLTQASLFPRAWVLPDVHRRPTSADRLLYRVAFDIILRRKEMKRC